MYSQGGCPPATVGAGYDRGFVRTGLPCVLDVKNARSQTAPTVQSHSAFLESSDSHADIQISERAVCVRLDYSKLETQNSKLRLLPCNEDKVLVTTAVNG